MEGKKSVVCFGEILWDVLPDGKMPGGAPMNVAYHLEQLGMGAIPVSFVGKDKDGDALREILIKQGTDATFVQQHDTQATGLVYTHLQANNEVQYDIVYPSAWDFIEWEQSLNDLVAKSPYFVFGSLITRHEVSKSTLFSLLQVAQTKVLDINLRPPYYNKPIVEALLAQCNLLKLNNHELAEICSWYHHTSNEAEQLQLLQDKYNIPAIVVTKGSEGAVLLKKGSFYHHPGFKVDVVDTVGSGDAFLAGFLYASQKAAPDKALLFANAMGAFMAGHAGACPPYTLADLETFIVQQNK